MLINGEGTVESYLPSVLFGIVVVTELVSVLAIMGYHNRRGQMKLCTIAMICNLLWVACFAGLTVMLKGDATVHPSFASCLPVIAFVLTFLARRAIKSDEELVRSADRLR